MKGIDITLIKDDSGLFHPFMQPDIEAAAKIPVGEDNVFRLQRIRNPRHHRKYFALIKLAFQNQDTYQDEYVFRKMMEMKSGYYTPVTTDKEVTIYIPKSISYNVLDQDGFSDLYDKVFIEITKFLKIEKEKDMEVFLTELNSFG